MLLGSCRSVVIDTYELQDGTSPQSSPAASPTDPDTPTGTRIVAMRTTSDPQCSVSAEVSVSRSTPQGRDSWDAYRTRTGTARVATVANTGDSVTMGFEGYGCSDGSKVKGAPRIDGVAVGSGWFSLRSAYASIGGTVPPPPAP